MSVLTKPKMKITKLSQHIGAEVTGIDLTQPINEATRRELHQAVVDNIALVIRDQKFTPEQFLAAGQLFGEPMDRDHLTYSIPGVPFVHEVSSRHRSKDGSVKKVGPRWHSDHTNKEYPPKFTCLYAVELPAKGGGTSIANMRAGYDSLPEHLKQRIEGRKTANVIVASGITYHNNDRLETQREKNPEPIFQPLVRTNPDTGGKALYFHPTKTEFITGIDPAESQALLDELVSYALKPEFVYSHPWRLGDMLLWDNRSALHKANYDYDPADVSQHRLLYRVLIKGELPH